MSGSEAARGHDTPNLLSLHIHPISSSCLLWITPTILLLWGLCRVNVRRIFSAVPWNLEGSINRFFDTSDLCEDLARDGRSLHVSLYSSPACYATRLVSLSSWEFFTTLDYEWRVIRGGLPYRWTIWVSND